MNRLTYSVAAAAQATSLSEDVINKAIRAGELPTYRAPQAKAKPLIKHDDLMSWITSWTPSERKAAPTT